MEITPEKVDTSTLVFAHPANIQRATLPDALLLDKVQTRTALDPSVFNERPPFFWRAEISSNRLDAYYTRMSDTTLRNFAADAEAGVGFQSSHNTTQLGVGRSLTGSFVGPQGNGVARVEADFYTMRGLRLNPDLSTDDFIDGVRSGLIADVSVGFYGGQFRCSMCGRTLWDWECNHVPGMEYAQTDPKTGVNLGEQAAFAWVDNARLAEVSAVYDGATPGAAIIKASQEAQIGRLRDVQRNLIEHRYRIRLPDKRMQVPGITLTPVVSIQQETGIDAAAAAAQIHEFAARATTASPAPESEREPALEGASVVSPQVEADQQAIPQNQETQVMVNQDERALEVATNTLTDAVNNAASQVPAGVDAIPPATDAPEPQAVINDEVPAGATNVSARPRTEVAEPGALADAVDRAERYEDPLPSAQRQIVAVETELNRAGFRFTSIGDGVRQMAERIRSLETDNTAQRTELATMREQIAQVRTLEAEVARLLPMADMGKQYRSDLIDQTITEGVRAHGGQFSEETYRSLLEKAELPVIKRVLADFTALAERQFTGGRQTIDNNANREQDVGTEPESAASEPVEANPDTTQPPATFEPVARAIPDAAFRV